jgi:flavin-dependent dehydrogenase
MALEKENAAIKSKYDVIVVGGGPAGSTFSTLLHEKGRNILLLEKDHHPRFHIGESLLPMTLP